MINREIYTLSDLKSMFSITVLYKGQASAVLARIRNKKSKKNGSLLIENVDFYCNHYNEYMYTSSGVKKLQEFFNRRLKKMQNV